jgi:hypothetical protein
MGVFGEVAKFLWFLCESIKEEPEACYIMATEFATVSIPVLMIMEPEWSYKKAEVTRRMRMPSRAPVCGGVRCCSRAG